MSSTVDSITKGTGDIMAKNRTGMCVKYLKDDQPFTCYWFGTDKEKAGAYLIAQGEAKKNAPAQVWGCVENKTCSLIETQTTTAQKILGLGLLAGLTVGGLFALQKLENL